MELFGWLKRKPQKNHDEAGFAQKNRRLRQPPVEAAEGVAGSHGALQLAAAEGALRRHGAGAQDEHPQLPAP